MQMEGARLIRGLTALGFIACLAQPMDVMAQTSQDSTLRRLPLVDAIVRVVTWDSDPARNGGLSAEAARIAANDKFTLELRKLGVRVSSEAPNVLLCSLKQVSTNEAPRVAALAYSVEFREWVDQTRLARPAWATLWSNGGIAVWGPSQLRDMVLEAATACAEKFGSAWLAMNPPR